MLHGFYLRWLIEKESACSSSILQCKWDVVEHRLSWCHQKLSPETTQGWIHIGKNWTKQSQDVKKMQRSQSCLTLSPRSATSGINVHRRSLHHGTGMVAQWVYSGTGVKCGCLLLAGWASHSSNKIKAYESWMESCSGRMEKIWKQPALGFLGSSHFWRVGCQQNVSKDVG